MPIAIFRDEVRRLVQEEGAQLVDVLPREAYEDEHLPRITFCSTISSHGRHKMNRYSGVILPWNRGFGTRSRLTG